MKTFGNLRINFRKLQSNHSVSALWVILMMLDGCGSGQDAASSPATESTGSATASADTAVSGDAAAAELLRRRRFGTGGARSVGTGGAVNAATGGAVNAATGGAVNAATGGVPNAATGGVANAALGGQNPTLTGGSPSTGGANAASSGTTPPAVGGAMIGQSVIPAERATVWNPGLNAVGGIPARTTICATIDAATYGNNSTDAYAAIQSALDNCPVGQVVRLPAGTYLSSNTLILTKGIVLRGDGPGLTKIVRTNAPVNNYAAVISIGWGGDYQNDTSVAVTNGLAKGSTFITVADASTFKPNDTALIDELDDPAVVYTGNCSWFKRNDGGLRSVGQMVEIKSVSGNVLELTSPLHLSFSAAMLPKITKPNTWYGPLNGPLGTVRYAGVEDLFVTNGEGANISMTNSSYSWLKNVEATMVTGRSIMIQNCYRCVLRDSYIHHATAYNTGGGSYGVSIVQSSDSLIENNIVFAFNTVIVMENSGGGNVIAYNYADDAFDNEAWAWQMPDINSHCSWPHMELIEGNQTANLVLDNVHGGSGDMTFYRNYATDRHRDVSPGDSFRDAISFGSGAVNVNVVGNVLMTPATAATAVYEVATADDCNANLSAVYRLGAWAVDGQACEVNPAVKAQILRHGNFDYVSNATVWDANIASHALPPSLYLATAPAFMGSNPWPFVDPDRAAKVGTLPAKARFDAIVPPPVAPFNQ